MRHAPQGRKKQCWQPGAKRYGGIGFHLCTDAFNRDDDLEVLRLLKGLWITQHDAVIFSPKLQEAISRTEARLMWREAKTSIA